VVLASVSTRAYGPRRVPCWNLRRRLDGEGVKNGFRVAPMEQPGRVTSGSDVFGYVAKRGLFIDGSD
jgi:hypothetical protein